MNSTKSKSLISLREELSGHLYSGSVEECTLCLIKLIELEIKKQISLSELNTVCLKNRGLKPYSTHDYRFLRHFLYTYVKTSHYYILDYF